MTRRRKSLDSNSLIVMTPMIDVMTVLLAVFIVTAPMLTSGIDMDLPRGGHSALTGDDHAVQIGIDFQGRYYFGKEQMSKEEIVKKVLAVRGENPKITIMLNGDRQTSYGAIMAIMGALKDAGVQKVGLRTKIEN
ncbi:MAG: biopolymer transporter ExbD [Rickettsiales bacterium]|jgi:biopolymer transport protein TolR|nr:biopolymer transporter ExbD [Rickettsiales bacterium]